ncbi:MAG: Actin-like protein arp9 (SWI/SNF complex component arp9) [Phylliscum demangeonii]|nr:MAG: Actin-like protein arp9 (SWI/SNF complex component arp9) [Phylliscum demangeonii]
MPAFKDEHILLLAPGSQTTLAQLGLAESFTPARLRVPTRMFPGRQQGEWEPYRRVARPRARAWPPGPGPAAEGGGGGATSGAGNAGNAGDSDRDRDREPEWDEDADGDEDEDGDDGAVYPLTAGRVTNWGCFLALLTHVHAALSPPFHTPILLVTQAAWTAQDRERLTQFCFERFKTPAFGVMDGALAVCYAFGVATATVVEVGYEKCDVTAVVDFLAHDVGRAIAVGGAGGEAITQRLRALLNPGPPPHAWTRDMCEQLKKSAICEVLPRHVPLPEPAPAPPPTAAIDPHETTTAASAPASAAAVDRGPRPTLAETATAADDGGGGDSLRGVERSDGVLDVATIVASGKTAEFLARKEREKAERAAKKAGDAAASAAVAGSGPKPVRLPNARRPANSFIYEERRPRHRRPSHRSAGAAGGGPHRAGPTETDAAAAPSSDHPVPGPVPAGADTGADTGPDVIRRELEVGLERFRAADGGILDTIADTIHRVVMAVEEVSKRAELHASPSSSSSSSPTLALTHAPAAGFHDALVATLTAKYLISPSSATIFTSELPSALSTPLATGANTPQPQTASASGPSGGGGAGGGVNKLLLAATTASSPSLQLLLQHQQQNPFPAAASSAAGHAPPSSSAAVASATQHSSHGQTPTSIGRVPPPEYFPEWKEVGFDEAAFLGAQVAAKIVFVLDQGVSKGFLTRQEYNELGPQSVHDVSL